MVILRPPSDMVLPSKIAFITKQHISYTYMYIYRCLAYCHEVNLNLPLIHTDKRLSTIKKNV